MISGFYLINKPKGMTSHDVINILRKLTNERTIGHAGTLDPMATGLMIVAIGREFTKRISEFSGLEKTYAAEIKLGEESTTYDAEGEISKISDKVPTEQEIHSALNSFVPSYEQMPPAFSAKKIAGKKAYELARKNQKVELKPVQVQIKEIHGIDYKYPYLRFTVAVSAGTYIRSLAHDIGEKIGTGAYLTDLIRTKIGSHAIKDSCALIQLKTAGDLAQCSLVI